MEKLELKAPTAPKTLDEKIKDAVSFIKRAEKLAMKMQPDHGFWLSFSGGKDSVVIEILPPIAQDGCINTKKKFQDRGRYAGLVVFGIDRDAMDCGALSPIQTKYLKISNIRRLYTRLYAVYRRFFILHLNI